MLKMRCVDCKHLRTNFKTCDAYGFHPMFCCHPKRMGEDASARRVCETDKCSLNKRK